MSRARRTGAELSRAPDLARVFGDRAELPHYDAAIILVGYITLALFSFYSLKNSEMSPVALPLSLAAVLHGANDLRIEQRTSWPPRAGEAQVAVLATGLCGSDREALPFAHSYILISSQFITFSMAATATLPFVNPSFWVMRLQVS